MRCVTVLCGAVLLHLMEDVSEIPSAFTSRSLATAEKHYSQLDNETLAIIFGVQHFHRYVYGQPFTIVSDYRPLMHLLSPSKVTPEGDVDVYPLRTSTASTMGMLLGAYEYKIAWEDHSIADSLSHLPCQQRPQLFPHPQRRSI